MQNTHENDTLVRNVVLVGFSGAGKSTVGRELADALGWRFIDTDADVEARAGKSIADIFATEGEATFRALEAEVCAQASEAWATIIATGGGALLDDQTRKRFTENGVLILLHVGADEALSRLTKHDDRPLLAGSDAEARLRRLYTVRAPFYAQFNRRIDVDEKTVKAVVDEAIALLADLQAVGGDG